MADQANKGNKGNTFPKTFSQLVPLFYKQWIGLGVLLFILIISESLTPYRHVLYNSSDNEIWKYSYPLRANTVPPLAVPTVAIFVPLAVIAAYLLTERITLLEAHHAAFSALTCIIFTGILTNFIKVNVGRFRPHFVERCWPNGQAPVYETDGQPKCSDAAVNPLEGMKSFPSGHTAWSTAGLAYTSFFLLGKNECFTGGKPLHLVASVLPLGGAVWIGASRMQDYWHHWEDVAVGFALGFVFAWLFYRTAYHGVMTKDAGTLVQGLQSAGRYSSSTGNMGRWMDGSDDPINKV